MKIKILLLTIALTCFSCNDDDSDIPECLKVIIDDAEDSNTVSLTIKIERYLFNEKEVFLLVPIQAFVDIRFGVISAVDCELICSFGGFTGEDTCSPKFFENAEFIEIVWEKPG